MLAMAPPVISRRAAVISALSKQKPVSSAAMIVPGKARLNKATLMITFRLTSFSLNEGPVCDTLSPRLILACSHPSK